MEVKYKGCIYQYKKYVGFDGAHDKRFPIVLTKIKPIDPANKVIYIPSELDGKNLATLIMESRLIKVNLNWLSKKELNTKFIIK